MKRLKKQDQTPDITKPGVRRALLLREARWILRDKDVLRTLRGGVGLLLLSTAGASYLSYALVYQSGLFSLLSRVTPYLSFPIASLLSLSFVMLTVIPLLYGLYAYSFAVARGAEYPEQSIFYAFSKKWLRRFVLRSFLRSVRRILCLAISICGTAFIAKIAANLLLFYGKIAAASLVYGSAILLSLVLLVLFVLFSVDSHISIAFRLLCDHGVCPSACFRKSRDAVCGHRWELLRFYIGRLPGVVLSIFTLGLYAAFYGIPKFLMAHALYASV
ncbi:MAG: hypothetical protein IJW71_03010, partial [Clostridia bacterium]|nr:hypothetical protein [Clostridia bacterium]